MEEILEIVIRNLPLLYVPAFGAVLTSVVLRVKKRYIHEGYIFRRSTDSSREHHPSFTVEGIMPTENEIDLDIALQKFHQLGLEGGDLGYAYWWKVGQLLKRAAGMQVQIDELSKELERYQAKLRKRP